MSEAFFTGVGKISSSSVEDRSIFLGNVPLAPSPAQGINSMRAFCSKYGEIESLRLRSLPVEGTAVDEAGNQTLVRKVCAIKGKLGTQKGSMNVYVVFKSAESVALALKDNNVVMGEGKSARHVRIDHSKPSVFPPQRTVFLGGLPHYADEEELREHFAAALPGGQADIEAVRIVRDNETMVGKGIGYLLLSDRDADMRDAMAVLRRDCNLTSG
jgi:nucleolar protein 12